MLGSLRESLIRDNSFPYAPYVTYIVAHYLYLDYRNISEDFVFLGKYEAVVAVVKQYLVLSNSIWYVSILCSNNINCVTFRVVDVFFV